jgi:hypothetical protein
MALSIVKCEKLPAYWRKLLVARGICVSHSRTKTLP